MAAERLAGGRAREAVLRIVNEETGGPPRACACSRPRRPRRVPPLALDPHTELVEAHRMASAVEERIRLSRPTVADVHVDTEP